MIIRIHWDFTINAFQNTWKIILVLHTRPLFPSTKANYFIGQLWQLLTASKCRCANSKHDSSSPTHPRSFTFTIFREVSLRSKRFQSRYSFFFALVPTFSTNSRGNACYAPSFLVFLLSPQRSRRIRAETLATKAIAQSLTLVPRYFLLNRTETLATQAIKSTGKVPTSSVGTISKGFCFSSRFFPRGEGVGEFSGFQVTGMIEWGQKSKPQKIPAASNKTPKNPWTNI